MCILAHPRPQPVLPCTMEEVPHLGLRMDFKRLVEFSSWGRRSLRGGGLEDGVILPPSVLQRWVTGCLQGQRGCRCKGMEKPRARLKSLELCNPSLRLLGHLVWLVSVTVACPTCLIGCQVCGQPLSCWPQICKAQREGRKNLGRRAAGKCFPFCPSTVNPLHPQVRPHCRGLEGSRMKGDGTKAEPGAGGAKPWG